MKTPVKLFWFGIVLAISSMPAAKSNGQEVREIFQILDRNFAVIVNSDGIQSPRITVNGNRAPADNVQGGNQGPDDCSAGNPEWRLPMEDANAKSVLATLLTAKSLNKRIFLKGTTRDQTWCLIHSVGIRPGDQRD